MDIWDPCEVDFIECVGNQKARLIFEAHLPARYHKPEPSANAKDMEKLLRDKWERKRFARTNWKEYIAAAHEGKTLQITPREGAKRSEGHKTEVETSKSLDHKAQSQNITQSVFVNSETSAKGEKELTDLFHTESPQKPLSVPRKPAVTFKIQNENLKANVIAAFDSGASPPIAPHLTVPSSFLSHPAASATSNSGSSNTGEFHTTTNCRVGARSLPGSTLQQTFGGPSAVAGHVNMTHSKISYGMAPTLLKNQRAFHDLSFASPVKSINASPGGTNRKSW
eukprot:CAMPEP_0201486258 /NCGR_PEP_ID=MMETSP0151_2-20130828/10324_1 /ASSEMBLY_ACC=CAM_ASM_000257 /TAXON_ID=200890 /ORGANISM="Paramoeba atlantica, Strain 621/1 / CCAP 1560/9" /LENGTH=280 /DNA_ID=CAMNT_0047870799 /DNA_START=196 /DNA_END=1038 /DNA_ORIENTATION=-